MTLPTRLPADHPPTIKPQKETTMLSFISRKQNQAHKSLVCFALAVAVGPMTGCTDPGSPEDTVISGGTSGGGPMTTGIADDGGGGTAGTGGPYEIGKGCIVNPDPDDNLFGLKYQCRGAVGFTVDAEGLGQSVSDSLQVTFGNGNDDDPYEEPKVMACCHRLPANHVPCETDHYKYCVIDMIQTGCQSIGPNLEANASGVAKEAMLKAAAWVNKESSQEECVAAFVDATGIWDSAVECDLNNEPVFDLQAALANASWTFDPDGAIDQITIGIDGSVILGLFPDPDWDIGVEPDTCENQWENNDVAFLSKTSPAGPYDLRSLATSERADLVGPAHEGEPIAGEGDLSSVNGQCELCSKAAFDWNTTTGTGSLQWMVLHSAAAATVGTPKASVVLDRFRIELYDDISASYSGNSFTIPRGAARFVVAGRSITDGMTVLATNRTAITITRNEWGGSVASWSVSAFTLRFEDGSMQPWDVSITPSTWK